MDLYHIPPVHIVSAPLNNDVLFQQQSLLFLWLIWTAMVFVIRWVFHIGVTFTLITLIVSHFITMCVCVCVTAQTPQPVVHFINIRWDYIHLLWSVSNDLELKGSESFVLFYISTVKVFYSGHFANLHTHTHTNKKGIMHFGSWTHSSEQCGNSRERLLDGKLLFSFYLRLKTGNNAAISS